MKQDKSWEEQLKGLKDVSSPVKPELWSVISSQIGGATAVGVSITVLKWIGLSVAATSVVGLAIWNANQQENPKLSKTSKEDIVLNATPQIKEEKSGYPEETVLRKQEPKEKLISGKEKGSLENERMSRTSIQSSKDESAPNNDQKALPIAIEMPKAPEPIRTISGNEAKRVTTDQENSVQEKRTVNSVSKSNASIENALKSTPVLKVEWAELPNVFTPNGDGRNDEFFVVVKNIQEFSLVVLDPEQKVVWQTQNPDERWDGRNPAGEYVKKGQYVYFITGKSPEGKSESKYSVLFIK